MFLFLHSYYNYMGACLTHDDVTVDPPIAVPPILRVIEEHSELFNMAAAGDVDGVRMLLTAGVHPDQVNASGGTAMHAAAMCDSEAIAALLLEFGADANVINIAGITPLHEACIRGSNAALRVLLESKVDPNIPCRQGVTPLLLAVSNKHLSCVRMLLDAGARINDEISEGRTVLHMAVCCRGRSPAGVKFLLQNGADVDASDLHGDTALHQACFEELPWATQMLLDGGARCSPVNLQQETPLHRAMVFGDWNSGMRLILAGSCLTPVDQIGSTPLQVARVGRFTSARALHYARNAEIPAGHEHVAEENRLRDIRTFKGTGYLIAVLEKVECQRVPPLNMLAYLRYLVAPTDPPFPRGIRRTEVNQVLLSYSSYGVRTPRAMGSGHQEIRQTMWSEIDKEVAREQARRARARKVYVAAGDVVWVKL